MFSQAVATAERRVAGVGGHALRARRRGALGGSAGASASVEQVSRDPATAPGGFLAAASRRDVDSDFRFGYRFTQRLPPELQAEVREALKTVLSASSAGAVKGPQEPKLHAQKKHRAHRRQLYDNSAAQTQRRARASFSVAC